MFQQKPPLSTRTTRHTDKQINATRLTYTPAATRCSILYFVIANLGNINEMYQFSLEYLHSQSRPSWRVVASSSGEVHGRCIHFVFRRLPINIQPAFEPGSMLMSQCAREVAV